MHACVVGVADFGCPEVGTGQQPVDEGRLAHAAVAAEHGDFSRQQRLQRVHIFRRRSGDALEHGGAEVVGPEDLLDLLLVGPVTDQQVVFLLLVRVDLIYLRRGVRRGQVRPQRAGIRGAGTGPQTEQRMGRSLQLQRHVQTHPGPQGGLPGQQAVLLSLQAADLLEGSANPGAEFLRPRSAVRIEEFLFRDRKALDEQSILGLSIAFDGIQSRVGIRQFRHDLCQIRRPALQKRGPGGVCQLAVRLADLHTAQMQKTSQQFVPLLSHCHNPEFFHFYNGHLNLSQPFRQ